MKIKPIIDKWEIRGIQHISTAENRALVEHRIPGLAGSMLQDMGEFPTSITIYGTLHGDEVRDKFLEELRKKFVAGEPIPFMADIIAETDVKEVVIKNLVFAEAASNPDTICYQISLQEFTPPPQNESSSIEKELDSESKLGFQSLVEDAKLENTLTSMGLDSEKMSSLMDNIDSEQFNGLLDSLDKEGLGTFGDILGGLETDALKKLAESLGLSLPLAGYTKTEELLGDLLNGIKKMTSEDNWASAMSTTSIKIIAKLLLTLAGGGSSDGTDWGGITNTFKEKFT
ncbi:MAG: hypothetical protein ABH870_06320 [bacterium]